MKKFMLFVGMEYYPCGGIDDYEGDFDSEQECKEHFQKNFGAGEWLFGLRGKWLYSNNHWAQCVTRYEMTLLSRDDDWAGEPPSTIPDTAEPGVYCQPVVYQSQATSLGAV